MLIRSVLFNFQGAFLNFVFLISQTTMLLYHIFSSLSRGFSKVFWSFLDFLSFRCDFGSFACLVSQAFLLYHIFSSLSRGFSKFIFEPLFKPSRSDLTVCRFSRSSLFIISLCFRFVKRFFKLFWSFFLIFDHFVMFSSRSRDSFYIILSLFEKVNPFFKNIQKNFAQLVFRVLHKIYVFEYIK